VTRGLRAAVAAGQIDELFVDTLHTIARQESGSKPTPTGSPTWSDEDVDDLAFDTVDRVGTAKIVLAAERAANDTEFAGWLRAAIRTQLAQRARDTPAGYVIRTVDDALAEDDQFTLEGGLWRLAQDERTDSWDGDRNRLARAAWAVETKTIRHDPNAEKIQIAWRDDTRAVCKAILTESGPLPKVVLGEIVAERFNVTYESRFGYLDIDTDDAELDEVAALRTTDSASGDLDDEAAARWMLTQFTAEERVLLQAVVDGVTLRGIADELTCGKEKATAIRDRITEKLRRLAELAGDDSQTATTRLLRIVGQAEDVRHSLEDHGHARD
jgi:hypothetical protein